MVIEPDNFMSTDFSPKGKRMGRIVQNTLLVILSIVFVAVFGEIALRLAGRGEVSAVVSDPILVNRTVNRPGWDTRGWKNHVALPQADIVALGDSQTEGNNATVDDSWPQVLGRIASTSVYQMAMGGYGPVQYRALFDEAIALSPKTVVVGFYLGNDLQDAYRAAYALDHWKELRDPDFVDATSTEDVASVDYRTVLSTGIGPDSPMYLIYQIRLWVRAHSVFYASLGDMTRVFRERIGVAKTKQEKIDDVALFAAENPEMAYYEKTPGIETTLSPAYRFDPVSLAYPSTGEGWRITQERFRSLKEKAGENNIRLVIAVIPTKEGIYLERWRRTTGGIPPAFTAYDKSETELSSAVQAFCRSESLECIFVLASLADALERRVSIFGKTMDGHFIAAGYQIIAESIHQYLIFHKPTQP